MRVFRHSKYPPPLHSYVTAYGLQFTGPYGPVRSHKYKPNQKYKFFCVCDVNTLYKYEIVERYVQAPSSHRDTGNILVGPHLTVCTKLSYISVVQGPCKQVMQNVAKKKNRMVKNV